MILSRMVNGQIADLLFTIVIVSFRWTISLLVDFSGNLGSIIKDCYGNSEKNEFQLGRFKRGFTEEVRVQRVGPAANSSRDIYICVRCCLSSTMGLEVVASC